MKAIGKLDTDKFDAFLVNAGSRLVGDWIDRVVKEGKSVITFNSDVEDSDVCVMLGKTHTAQGC